MSFVWKIGLMVVGGAGKFYTKDSWILIKIKSWVRFKPKWGERERKKWKKIRNNKMENLCLVENWTGMLKLDIMKRENENENEKRKKEKA